jgi:uncharacterized membrane protein
VASGKWRVASGEWRTSSRVTEPRTGRVARGKAGIFNAFDACGLAEIARKNDLVIEIVPQVGDLVAEGDPLFQVYTRSTALPAARPSRRKSSSGALHSVRRTPWNSVLVSASGSSWTLRSVLYLRR